MFELKLKFKMFFGTNPVFNVIVLKGRMSDYYIFNIK